MDREIGHGKGRHDIVSPLPAELCLVCNLHRGSRERHEAEGVEGRPCSSSGRTLWSLFLDLEPRWLTAILASAWFQRWCRSSCMSLCRNLCVTHWSLLLHVAPNWLQHSVRMRRTKRFFVLVTAVLASAWFQSFLFVTGDGCEHEPAPALCDNAGSLLAWAKICQAFWGIVACSPITLAIFKLFNKAGWLCAST